ncbi:tRNA 2'-phosphotransferase 1-like isoform X6 [Rhineura floridana]|uniref:tRNA 2'-phosphotransferase 1-like isoform X6 n=1 Tax=Rhineura floridana TaxID=261503 RepID=UPI002AC88AAF|nr:tRNA 2'-phosphotransferase 1-like isoform X6 [Rhineura floridana]
MDAERPSVEGRLQNPTRRDKKRANRRRHRDQDPDVCLSKALSYALRHGAQKLGLHMGCDGFVDVAELLRLPQFKLWNLDDVRRVVETNEKQRFAVRLHPSGGHLQIRANQGHSLQVSELELNPLLELSDFPEVVAHGTYLRHWPAIRLSGLSRMGRTHIHLAAGLSGDGAVLSGMRNNCEVAVVIDVTRALADGITFYSSANGVILTPGDANGLLLPCYFREALQLRPRRKLHGLFLPLQPGHVSIIPFPQRAQSGIHSSSPSPISASQQPCQVG